MLLSVLEPDGAIIVIGTRYSALDLYGWLSDDDSPEKDQIDILIREAIDDDGNLLFPEVLTKEFLEEQRKTQGEFMFACNPAGAPILMADWTTKPIEEIKPGDKVIGFELGSRAKLVETIVEECNSRISEIVELELGDGTKIRCTPDHKWFTRKSLDKSHRSPYSAAKVGTRLKRVVNCSYTPTPEELLDWRYLAGMIDGEGACKHGSIQITQSETKNPAVSSEIRKVLTRLKIDFTEHKRAYKGCTNFIINSGRDTKLNLLKWGKPTKKDQIIAEIMNHGNRIVGGDRTKTSDRDQVKKISPIGTGQVYALKTKTGNYVVWGYASKNCQYLNRPVSSGTCYFAPETIKFYDTPPKGLIYFLTLDPAISTKARSDYSAFIVNGVDHLHNWYILEAIQKKLTPSEVVKQVFDLYEKYKIQFMLFGMEKHTLEQVLKLAITEEQNKRGIAFPIKELPTDTRVSKENRIRALQPRFQNGQIYIHKSQTALYHQILYYPLGTKHDDLLDALKSQLAVTFPSPFVSEINVQDYPNLTPIEQKIWKDAMKLGTRKVRQKGYRL
jgi:predicted phage terminase large subunit-like protein